MSDFSASEPPMDTDPSVDTDPAPEPPAQLREAAKRGREASRELAFVKAGIDTDSPAGAMFMAGYKGEATKEAITTAWSDVVSQFGPPTAPADPEPAAPSAEDHQRNQLMTEMVGDSIPPDQSVAPDPNVEGNAAFRDAMSKGATRQEASAHLTQRLVDSAVNGDKRAIWTGWTADELEQARSVDGVVH